MSHEVENMAYVGEKPWHGLGNPVQAGVSVDQMRKDAGLDWKVNLADMHYTVDGQMIEMASKVMYREDTRTLLDVVGPKYVPTQNEEVLEFFREYVEAGDMHLETAGSLKRGQIVWALARMDINFELRGADRVEGYVLISNPHRYGQGMTVKFTPVRVVCWNTLTMSLHGSGDSVKLWHNRAFDETVRQEAKERLGIARERLTAFEENARKLASININLEDAEEVLEEVFPKNQRVRNRVLELFMGDGKGSTLPSSDGTAWGLLNATTEYYDWHASRNQDNRLRNSWFGQGNQKKLQIMGVLLNHEGAGTVEGR